MDLVVFARTSYYSAAIVDVDAFSVAAVEFFAYFAATEK